MLALALEI